MKLIGINTLVCFLMLGLHAQELPEERKADWHRAGLSSFPPATNNQVNALDLGIVNDGETDMGAEIQAAVRSFNGQPGVIYFPPGTYLCKQSITLSPGAIVQGAGSNQTHFIFDLGDQRANGFNIGGTDSRQFVAIESGYTKGSNQIRTDVRGAFQVGDFAEIRQENGVWDSDPATWAANSLGQFVKITAVNGKELSFEPPLRIDYGEAYNPEIGIYQPIEFTGIEDLSIERIPPVPESDIAYNIFIRSAVNCWVRGVESKWSVGSHITISLSRHIEITGNHFHNAHAHNGVGTRGYGVMLNNHSSECLIENNVFNHLRHSMMVKEGANANVFAYNFSDNPCRSEAINDYAGDISLHGHYPYANLFEGNIVQTIYTDGTWGPSGPGNTFLRNRTEAFGILLTNGATNEQNYVGNDILSGKGARTRYKLKGTGHFEYANNVKGKIEPETVSNLTDQSYFYQVEPPFWPNHLNFPPIGLPNAHGTGNIPAKERYIIGGKMTVSGNLRQQR